MTFEPNSILLCNWCAYAGADLRGNLRSNIAKHR